MSSFTCGECGIDLIDTPQGYVTECDHYKISPRTDRACPKCGMQIFDPFGWQNLIHDVNKCAYPDKER